MTAMECPIVEFRHISKAFSGVSALDDVSFSVKRGTVHCLLGENGAGKSTLIKILTGVLKEDSGSIFFDGEELKERDIWITRKKGIGTVFQENSLVPHLNVSENVFLSRELRKSTGVLNFEKMKRETIRWAEELGIELDPSAKVKDLSVAEQQIVEIVKMFSQSPKFVILDEPTSSLSDKEIEKLFQIINRMKEKGVTFIYISHRMEEIKEIGDDASILRDGRYIEYIDNVKNIDMNEIISYVVGRPLVQIYPERHAEIGDVFFSVEGLTDNTFVRDVSFSVRKGEVLGFSGLVGSGRTETAKALFGVTKKKSGKIYKNGEEIEIKSPSDAIRHGLGFLTENRKEEGLFLNKSVSWNTVAASLDKVKVNGVLSRSKERDEVNKFVNQLKIKLPSIDRAVKYLSGGNQQKVVFAKWLMRGSNVYIFDEPTRGIDIGAKTEVYKIINSLAEAGNAVIVISSELPEVLGVSDRVAVFREGRIVKFLDIKDATQEKIMFYAMGGVDNETA